MEAPCKDCLDRKIGCHSNCEKYLEFKKEKEFERQLKYNENYEKLLDRETVRRRFKNYKR